MALPLEPGLARDLADAKAALARHGIVIARSVEVDLVPAIMIEARASMEDSSRKLSALEDKELDRFVERIRNTAANSAQELSDIYSRALTKLGSDDLVQLIGDLDGIDQLFKWPRIAKVTEKASSILEGKGFRRIELEGPGDVSEGLELELCEKWPAAFERFKSIVQRGISEAGMDMDAEAENQAKPKKKQMRRR